MYIKDTQAPDFKGPDSSMQIQPTLSPLELSAGMPLPKSPTRRVGFQKAAGDGGSLSPLVGVTIRVRPFPSSQPLPEQCLISNLSINNEASSKLTQTSFLFHTIKHKYVEPAGE